MKVLKRSVFFELNKGDGQARGLYNVSERNFEQRVSKWFDSTELKNLIGKPLNEFNKRCKELIEI